MFKISFLAVLAVGWWATPAFGCPKTPRPTGVFEAWARTIISLVPGRDKTKKQAHGILRVEKGYWQDSREQKGEFVAVLHLEKQGWIGCCVGTPKVEKFRYTLLLSDGRQAEFVWSFKNNTVRDSIERGLPIKRTGGEFVLVADDDISLSISYVEGERLRKGNVHTLKASTITTITTGDYELQLRSHMKEQVLLNFLHYLPTAEVEGRGKIIASGEDFKEASLINILKQHVH